VSYLFELEDADPAEALMTEMKIELFYEVRHVLGRFVRGELGRSLLVILLPDSEAA